MDDNKREEHMKHSRKQPDSQQVFVRYGDSLRGVGLGIIVGSGLTYYFNHRNDGVNADTFVLLIGIAVIITGAVVILYGLMRGSNRHK